MENNRDKKRLDVTIRNKKATGKNGYNYVDGRCLKKYFCIDCAKEIGYQTALYGKGKCFSCSRIIHGKTNKQHYCKDCGDKISSYQSERCPSCCRKGKNHWCYIDGRSFEPYPQEFNDELKAKIRKRDNYKCQYCNMTEEEHLIVYGRMLEIHHINYNKQNCDEENLITLCKPCNIKVNKNRKYWIIYFKDILLKRY